MTLALKVMKNAPKRIRTMHTVSFDAKILGGSYPNYQEKTSMLTEKFDASVSRNYITLTVTKLNSVTD